MSFEYSGLFSDLTDTSTEGYAKLLTSGLLVFTTNVECDVFLVGGGGNGGAGTWAWSLGGGGGGGGYTLTYKRSDEGWRDGDALNIPDSSISTIVIGEAGEATSLTNNDISLTLTANPGANGVDTDITGRDPSPGGSGGSGGGAGYNTSVGGAGGSDGSNGTGTNSGTGQGHTTREFGEEQGTLYAGGGGSGGGDAGNGGSGGIGGAGGGGNGANGNTHGPAGSGENGQNNTGGGGGGGGYSFGGSISPTGGSGGSGIVVIRWRVLGPGPGTGYPAWMTRNGVWVKVNKVMI